MKRVPRVLLIAAAAVLMMFCAGWLWWSQVRQDPNRVFWDMLSANLSTRGFTRSVIQQGNGLSVAQYTQLSFTQHPTAHALTIFKQNGNTLATEEISDRNSDFVRYQQIHVPSKIAGKSVNTSAVLGKWARLGTGQSVGVQQLTSGLYQQSLLDVLPMGNLSVADRNRLLTLMRERAIFSYDSKAVKQVKIDGRQVYVYTVSIKPEAYVTLMQQFEPLVGAKAYAALKASSVTHAKPISIVLSVDARSHTLSQLYEVSAGRTQRYQGFGITDTMQMPHATISTTELTRRLSQLQ
jgi:hypothetical protein